MITLLQIQNLILIESAQIPFRKGLNILSGETGAGKTAVMQAIKLIAGEKGDPKWVRHHTEKAVIEAEFDLPENSQIWQMLKDAGFDPDPKEPLIIRRDLPVKGKSRVFINQKLASLPFLNEIGEHLFDIASQNASIKLGLESFQRESLDRFFDLCPLASQYEALWLQEVSLKEELEGLQSSESERLRQIETIQREVQEIEAAELDPEEEEALFQEYSTLATFEERSGHLDHALKFLENVSLSPLEKELKTLSDLDPKLVSIKELASQAAVELQEIHWELSRYQEGISFSPEKMTDLDDRLKLINRLKKKYGSTIEEILAFKGEQEERLKTLSSSDDRIEALTDLLPKVSAERAAKMDELTEKRKASADLLSELMTQELQSLNMKNARFEIQLKKKAPGRYGQDEIVFCFLPNPGSKVLSVKEAASGGELARIFLSLKTLLRKKEGQAVLIFDEVDANIGGTTAKLLGQKLKSLGENTQVITITHFPQVAGFADHHLRVQKVESESGVKSIIEELPKRARDEELARMIGAAG
ncbi:MAG: DNA repair protein RecN [Chlamydiia bacterium]|nr:DNA repair protein RecN [Chlamydiia bacterium]